MFGSYKGLWKPFQDFPSNHQCKKVKKLRNSYFEPVIQVKIELSEFEYHTEFEAVLKAKIASKIPTWSPQQPPFTSTTR